MVFGRQICRPTFLLVAQAKPVVVPPGAGDVLRHLKLPIGSLRQTASCCSLRRKVAGDDAGRSAALRSPWRPGGSANLATEPKLAPSVRALVRAQRSRPLRTKQVPIGICLTRQHGSVQALSHHPMVGGRHICRPFTPTMRSARVTALIPTLSGSEPAPEDVVRGAEPHEFLRAGFKLQICRMNPAPDQPLPAPLPIRREACSRHNQRSMPRR